MDNINYNRSHFTVSVFFILCGIISIIMEFVNIYMLKEFRFILFSTGSICIFIGSIIFYSVTKRSLKYLQISFILEVVLLLFLTVSLVLEYCRNVTLKTHTKLKYGFLGFIFIGIILHMILTGFECVIKSQSKPIQHSPNSHAFEDPPSYSQVTK